LFLGTGLGCNTLIHGVEEWAGVPGRLTESREALLVRTPQDTVLEVPSRRHVGDPSKYYAKLEPVFFAAGALKLGKLGDASCHLLEASVAASSTLGLLARDPQLFSHAGLV